MSGLEVRPTVATDLDALMLTLPYRFRGVTGVLDGRVVGVGGVGYRPDGVLIATAVLRDEARAHKFTVHRTARKFLQSLASDGVRDLVAIPDDTIAGACAWLERLGFKPVNENGGQVYRWQNSP